MRVLFLIENSISYFNFMLMLYIHFELGVNGCCRFFSGLFEKAKILTLNQMLVITAILLWANESESKNTNIQLMDCIESISMGSLFFFGSLLFFFGERTFQSMCSHFNCILWVQPPLCGINHWRKVEKSSQSKKNTLKRNGYTKHINITLRLRSGGEMVKMSRFFSAFVGWKISMDWPDSEWAIQSIIRISMFQVSFGWYVFLHIVFPLLLPHSLKQSSGINCASQ